MEAMASLYTCSAGTLVCPLFPRNLCFVVFPRKEINECSFLFTSWYESGAGFNAAGCVQRPTLLSSETCVKLSTFKTLAGYPFSDILD